MIVPWCIVWCNTHGHRLTNWEKFWPSVVGVKKPTHLIMGMTNLELTTAVHRRHIELTKVLIVPFLNEHLMKLVDVSRWVGTPPPSSVHTIPDMLDGDEIRTVSGPVINEINVICSKKIYSVSSCMRCGIIVLKNQDVGVVMEQRNDVMSENVIAVP